MTNCNLVKARMKELELVQADVARYLDITETTVCMKLNGKREFKVSEIERLSALLQIEDKDPYFFAQK